MPIKLTHIRCPMCDRVITAYPPHTRPDVLRMIRHRAGGRRAGCPAGGAIVVRKPDGTLAFEGQEDVKP